MKQEVTPIDGFHYSTTEQWTGKYWIDGKKIYQKAIEFSGITDGNIVPLNVSVEKIISIQGMIHTQSNNAWDILNDISAYGFARTLFNPSNNSISLQVSGFSSTEWINGGGHFIVRYTKTTD